MALLSDRKAGGRARGALLLGCCLAATGVALAAEPAASEYAVKAAFLYNFVRFVEWPAETLAVPGTPLTLCIFGDDPFGAEIDRAIAGKIVSDHPLVVSRIRRVADATPCTILFVGGVTGADAAAVLAAVRDRPVLTVGESERFLDLGGIIAFSIDNNRVHFSINADAAAQAHLRISSQLLKLADVVLGSRTPRM